MLRLRRRGLSAPVQSPVGTLLTGQAALGDWSTDAPGVRRKLSVGICRRRMTRLRWIMGRNMVPRPDGAMPKAPAGFEVSLFAEHLSNPRKIVTAPNGDIFVAESGANRIKILRAADGAAHPQTISVFADDLSSAVWDRILPKRAEPEIRVCCEYGLGRAVPLHERRLEGIRGGAK